MNAKTFFTDRPIAYHPILAKTCGSVTAALFLSQLAYWSDKGNDRDGWIYKTEAEMNDETGLSRSEQQTARRTLMGLGVLHEERRGIPARMWYLIDWTALDNLIVRYQQQVAENLQTGCRKPANSTEITTENNNNNNNAPVAPVESNPVESAPLPNSTPAPQLSSQSTRTAPNDTLPVADIVESHAAWFAELECVIMVFDAQSMFDLADAWKKFPDPRRHNEAMRQLQNARMRTARVYLKAFLNFNPDWKPPTETKKPIPRSSNGHAVLTMSNAPNAPPKTNAHASGVLSDAEKSARLAQWKEARRAAGMDTRGVT